jgi:hypothetical protein
MLNNFATQSRSLYLENLCYIRAINGHYKITLNMSATSLKVLEDSWLE